jgi:hypothetical protein
MLAHMESLDHGLEPLWVKPGYACSYGVLRSWVRTCGSNQTMLAHMESLDHGLELLWVKPGYMLAHMESLDHGLEPASIAWFDPQGF